MQDTVGPGYSRIQGLTAWWSPVMWPQLQKYQPGLLFCPVIPLHDGKIAQSPHVMWLSLKCFCNCQVAFHQSKGPVLNKMSSFDNFLNMNLSQVILLFQMHHSCKSTWYHPGLEVSFLLSNGKLLNLFAFKIFCWTKCCDQWVQFALSPS